MSTPVGSTSQASRVTMDEPVNTDARQPVPPHAPEQHSSEASCYPDLFSAWARATPEAVAVQGAQGTLSYAELDRRARTMAVQLACLLRETQGRGPNSGVETPIAVTSEQVVALCLHREPELIVSLLAVAMCGGVALPLDPSYPGSRLRQLLDDSTPQLLICNDELAHRLDIPGSLRRIDPTAFRADTASDSPRDAHGPTLPDLHSSQLAFLLYTSGSTGRPKGVMMSHGGRLRRQLWTQDRYRARPGDRHLLKSPLGFGTLLRELLWPLTSGGVVVLAADGAHREGLRLTRLLQQQRVSHLSVVPSLLRELLELPELRRCPALRHVIATGEAMPVDLQQRFFAGRIGAKLHTFYGSTEIPTATYWDFRAGDPQPCVTAGQPTNLPVLLMDRELHQVEHGAPGEICIGGEDLARGYYGQPRETALRFVPDPGDDRQQQLGARLYRTGDLARWRPDGRLLYLGRADRQVQIRGQRVEPGEVAAALRRHPELRDAAVLVIKQQLIAFCELAASRSDGEFQGSIGRTDTAARSVDEARLLRFAQAQLPAAMVPQCCLVLPHLPRNVHGKVDHEALVAAWREDSENRQRNLPGGPPHGPLETLLATIWMQALDQDELDRNADHRARTPGAPATRETVSSEATLPSPLQSVPVEVGREQSFLALGGHSLAALRVTMELRRRLGIELSVATVLQHGTLRELAEVLAERHNELGQAAAWPEEPAQERIAATPPGLQFQQQAASELRQDLAPDQAARFDRLRETHWRAVSPAGDEYLAGHQNYDPALILYPLSSAQQRLWFHSLARPNSAAYNVRTSIELQGALATGTLDCALCTVVSRHQSLRQAILHRDGLPFALETEAPTSVLMQVDLRSLLPEQAAVEARKLSYRVAAWPFELARPPLLRCILFRQSSELAQLELVVPHLAFDGESRSILLSEVAELYSAREQGRAARLPSLRQQVSDVAAQERGWLSSEQASQSKRAWASELREIPRTLKLPGPGRHDHRDDGSKSAATAAQVRRLLDSATAKRLASLANEQGVTLFTLAYAVFALLLHRLSGQGRVLIGTPVSLRAELEAASLIGCFVNPVPLLLNLSSRQEEPRATQNPMKDCLVTLLRRAQGAVFRALEHARLPLDVLVQTLNPDRAGGSDHFAQPLFDLSFNFLQGPLHDRLPTLHGVRARRLSTEATGLRSGRSLYLLASEQGWRLRLVVPAGADSEAWAETLLDQYIVLLRQLADKPHQRLRQLSLLTESQQDWLPQLDQALELPRLETLSRTLWQGGGQHPDSSALAWDGLHLSYGQLLEQAAQLCSELHEQGISQGHRVVVSATPCPGLVIALLATMRLGAPFMILDQSLPARRQQRLLSKTRPQIVLRIAGARSCPDQLVEIEEDAQRDAVAHQTLWELDPTSGQRVENSTEPFHQPAGRAPKGEGPRSDRKALVDSPPLPPLPRAVDPACIFFTSGSTGEPKGLVFDHRSVAHFLAWERTALDLCSGPRVALLSRLSFDAVLRDLMLPLSSGGCLHIPSAELEQAPHRVLPWLQRHRVQVVHTVPAVAQTWIRSLLRPLQLDCLRHLLLSGQSLSQELVRRWQELAPGLVIRNLYGATETVLCKVAHAIPAERASAASHRPSPGQGTVPVGRALPQAEAWVQNAQGQGCGVGEAGEIVLRTPYRAASLVDGPLLAKGSDPASSSSGFRRNPARPEDPEDLLYFTGDLGYWQYDGTLQVLGRKDRQVKVRGARVEPLEIELALLRLPQVQAAAVHCHSDSDSDSRLVAYLVPQAGMLAPADAEQGDSSDKATEHLAVDPLKPASLRAALQASLPSYMVPSSFQIVDALPTTPTGKVDYTNLPSLPGQSAGRSGDSGTPEYRWGQAAASGTGTSPGGPTTAHGAEPSVLASTSPVREQLTFPYRLPGRPSELRLVRIWEELLGVEPIGIDDSFFELGGHSLLAVRLLVRIEAAFGVPLDLSALFPRATVRSLAKRLEQGDARRPWEPLVPIQPIEAIEGTRSASPATLFCAHPAGGSVLGYVDLSRCLGPAQPLYGLAGPDPRGTVRPIGTLRGMAERYVQALRALQPQGPYLLAGYSFGGLLAYEMAQQLTRDGAQVAMLTLLDSGPPRQAALDGGAGILSQLAGVLSRHGVAEDDESGRDDLLWRELAQLAQQHLKSVRGNTGQRNPRGLGAVQELFRRYRLLPVDSGVGYDGLRRYLRLLSSNFNAGREYRPSPASFPITLIRARHSGLGSDPQQRTEAWRALAKGPFAVHTVEATHLSLLRPPAVEQVAMQLRLVLAQATKTIDGLVATMGDST